MLLPLELAGAADASAKAGEALKSVGLEARQQHYPKQLSGGEKQRVAIARAFVSQPAVLFADEPTGNLDSTTGERVADLLFDMNTQYGTTLILVTHDSTLAQRCSRSLYIDGGELQQ